MEYLERRSKFMSQEVVTLKDAFWRLTKRITALERFILKQFGNSTNVLDIYEHDLDDLFIEDPCARKTPPKRGRQNIKIDSEEDDATYIPGARAASGSKRKRGRPSAAQPTRYGRTPRQVQLSNYIEGDESSSDCNAEPLVGNDHDEDEDGNYDNDTFPSELGSFEANMTESGNEVDVKPNTSSLIDESETGEAEAEKHICPECNASFPEKVYLNIHKRKEHPEIYAPVPRVKPRAQQAQPRDPTIETKIEFMESRRGGVFLCVDDYVFARRQSSAGVEYYRCKKQGCFAAVRVKDAKLVPGTLVDNHNHPNHRDEINRLKLVYNIRERVDNEPDKNIKTIFKEEREKLAAILGVDPAVEFPTLASLKSRLYRTTTSGAAGSKGSSTNPSQSQSQQLHSGDEAEPSWMNNSNNGIPLPPHAHPHTLLPPHPHSSHQDAPNSSMYYRF